MTRLTLGFVLAALMLGVAACSKESPPEPKPAPTAPKAEAPATPVGVTISSISLGKALGPDKKVTAPTDIFAKNDTIYAVVETAGAGNATLKAKWTYHKGDKAAPVSEDTQTISASGPATSEFHISKPDGWPSGEYRVEVFVDDKSAGTKTFTVK
jgi:hypothetical protein